MNVPKIDTKLTAKDFATDQDVRWCPGCGDYAILKAVQRTMPELGVPKENMVFISGIGCAARFPYYMDTYGFHTIHGRAPAFATGLKLSNPELDVWVVSGDGDALSIGGNHLLHVLRRNVNLQFLLFNNEIYGLTKGQYSPTSRLGTRSPSTPLGSVDRPTNPCAFALGTGARFVGRSYDVGAKHLPEVLKRAHAHPGTGFVEILQNCIVYNNGVFGQITEKGSADETQLLVTHGEPLIYGKDKNKGIRLNPKTLTLEAVVIGEDGITEDDILVHDQTNPVLATLLAQMEPPNMPVAMGVLYDDPAPTYEVAVTSQVTSAMEKKPNATLNELLHSGHTWTV